MLEHSRMSPHVQLAHKLGDLIAKEDYAAAHRMLTRQAQIAWPVQEMKRRSDSMRSYSPGPFTDMQVMEEFMLEDWPAMQDGDVASIYISLSGDNFCEAVSVIVTQEDGDLRIRDLEWGRP
jgi:hypothetical protein